MGKSPTNACLSFVSWGKTLVLTDAISNANRHQGLFCLCNGIEILNLSETVGNITTGYKHVY